MELAVGQVQPRLPRYIVFDHSGAGLRRSFVPPPAAEHTGVPSGTQATAMGLEALHRTRRSRADDLATKRPIQSGTVTARSVHAETSDADAVSDAGTSGSEAAEEESGDEVDSFDASFCQEGFATKIEALAELVGMKGACEPVAVLSEVVRVLRSIDTTSEYIPYERMGGHLM